MIVTVVDSYPRVSEDDQRLRRAIAEWEDGRISGDDLEKVAQEVTDTVIREQIQAGVDLLTDGQVRWDDPISYLAQKLSGIKRGGLLRWFDNNFYFRQPVIVGPLERSSPLLVDDWVKASRVADPVPVKPVLTGPFTFAIHCLDQYYHSLERLLEAVTLIWKEEITDLAHAGAPLIQINEPSVLFHPDKADLWKGALTQLVQDCRRPISLYTFFADPTSVWDDLMSLPFFLMGLDFCSGEENRTATLLQDWSDDKTIGCGIMDARNIRAEPVDDLARTIESLAHKVGDTIHVNPNCGLELLPRSDARKKLEHLSRAVQLVIGSK